MEFPWTIDTDPDEELVLPEELAPFVIEEGPVGLEGISDYHTGFAIFFL
jgi:hypothetical protein